MLVINQRSTASGYRRFSLWLACIGILAFMLADIELSQTDPVDELSRIFWGILTPDLSQTEDLIATIATTLCFALVAICLSAIVGLAISPFHHLWWVNGICTFVRSIHELFWALIFLQIFGLSSLTGVLAIALPYAGTFARVYRDILDQGSVDFNQAFCGRVSGVSKWLYGGVAQCWPALTRYTRYRFECGLRSATVLGFIGLPTIGYYLETAFSQGLYHQAGGLLLLFYGVIATIKYWLKAMLIPVYLVLAILYLPWKLSIEWQYIWRFISEDIVPSPLRSTLIDWQEWHSWWVDVAQQVFNGGWATLMLSFAALLLSAVLTLILWPLASKAICRRGYMVGHGLLIVLRSTPELIIAFMVMLVIGPSMLPAIIALALHNSAIIAYLLARTADQLPLRHDKSSGLNLWAYELQPRIYPSFIAFLCYRFEIILRESAMLGILGVTTLGFYIDSAFEAMFFDVAMMLILASALLNMIVSYCASRLNRSRQLFG